MTRRHLLLWIPLSVLGYLTLFFLFPRTNPSAKWHHLLDRSAAIQKAREAALKFGIETTGWTPLVITNYDRDVEFYLNGPTYRAFASLLTPTTMTVRLSNFRTGQTFQVRMNSRGTLLGLRRRDQTTSSPKKTDQSKTTGPGPETKADPAQDLHIAEEVLIKVFGSERNSFSAPPTSSEDQGKRKYTWITSDDRLRLAAEATVENGKVTDLITESTPTIQFRAELNSRYTGLLRALYNADHLVVWPSIIGIIIAYFIGLARRQINHRQTLLFLLFCFLFILTITLLGGSADRGRLNTTISGIRQMPALELIVPWVVVVLMNLAFAAGLYFLYASGTSLSSENPKRRTIDFELLLKGKFLTRPVVNSFVGGLLAGGLLCALPPVLAASGLLRDVLMNASGLESSFPARFPALVSFTAKSQYLLFLVFAFLAPMIAAFVTRALLVKLLTFVTVWLAISGTMPIYSGFSAALIVTLLSALLLNWVYFRFGLLSTTITMMSAQAAVTAGSLLAQHNASFQASGWKVIGGLSFAILIGFIGLGKAREVRPEEIAIKAVGVETRADRERLKAEFDVARRAQQHMLPDAPPSIPGLNIAAVCHPSKEVGGDLYDFIALRDGRLGIVVADVSGKGVPASLYMTLTKGLVDSISEEKADPGEILREVNRHLYVVCKRKMFVTLFLGVIDPATKTLTYARAGHNPTVFRRPAEQKTLLLTSRGMGLGLNNGNLFDQSLTVESLKLQHRDKLFFYSDGITEAMNGKKEEYGEERLMAMAAKADALNANQARDSILADVQAFLGETLPQDDQTLVVVEITN